MTVETEMEKESVEKGWEAVNKGTPCQYPLCDKKAQTAAYHGVPLCADHFNLAQFISFIVYRSHEKPMHDDQFKSVVRT